MYKPLPKSLTIRRSGIEGLGLFAVEPIKSETQLGVSHVRHNSFSHGWIRTPLGGFYNHSNNPNCKTTSSVCKNWIFLSTIKDISPGEELTCIYTLYYLESVGE